MIVIIGNEDEVMGFGLGGINDAHIVPHDVSKEEVTELISKYSKSDVVLVSEKIYGMHVKTAALCVRIPGANENEHLDKMTKEILGLTLSELRERLQ